MISNYIKELIQNEKRVIIPDLGAFMIQNTPNGKVISFNDFLKFNDGMLVNKIIVNEHFDTTKSKELIKKFVKDVENALKDGGKFPIEGIGYLLKTDRGEIVFEQDENAKAGSSAEASGSSAKSTKAKKTKTAEPADSQKTEAPEKQEPATEPTPADATVNVSATNEGKTGDNIVEVESSPIEQIEKPAPAQSKQIINNQINNSNNKQTIKQKSEMEIKTKNKTLNIVLIVVSALIIIGAIVWAVINFHLIDRFRPAQQPVEEPIIVVDTMPEVADSTAIDSTLIEPEPEPVVEEPAVDNSSYYYIIAGSFQNQSYAESFEQQMKDAGFDAHTVQNGSFHCVGLKRFATEREAYNELRVMTAENPNLWVLYK